MTDAELLLRAIVFKLNKSTTIEKRSEGKWAVVDNGVLNKSLEWEYEPMPSSRDDEFIARTRFDSIELAVEAAQKAGVTFDDL